MIIEFLGQCSMCMHNVHCIYLLNRMEVVVVEVPEEPEHPGTQHLTQQHDKGSKVEDEDHSRQPVEEHDCA